MDRRIQEARSRKKEKEESKRSKTKRTSIIRRLDSSRCQSNGPRPTTTYPTTNLE